MNGSGDRKACPCRLCGASDQMKILYSFGLMPVAGYLETHETVSRNAPRYELAIAICTRDGLVQQAYEESTDVLNNRVYSNYQATYSMSETVLSYMTAFLDKAIRLSGVQRGDCVVEIGSNDGRVLSLIKSRGFRPIGFEPASNLVLNAGETGLEVINDYFGAEAAHAFVDKYQPVPLVITRHTLEHAYDPVDFLRGLQIILSDRGLAVIEVPYLRLQMQNNHFEGMTFQHVSFFTLTSMMRALRAAGLELVDVSFVRADGGSAVFYVRKTSKSSGSASRIVEHIRNLETVLAVDKPSGYESFFLKVHQNRAMIRACILHLAAEGVSVLGYGAGSKGQAMVNMLGLDSGEIRFVIDDSPGSAGRYIPGTGISIVSSGDSRARRPDVILLLAPTHIQEILGKERGRMADGTRFLSTVPDFHFVATDGL